MTLGYDHHDKTYDGVQLAKMKFQMYDVTAHICEWIQICRDFFVDRKIYDENAKVCQATFVLTGAARQ